jgi:hypothetical protein
VNLRSKARLRRAAPLGSPFRTNVNSRECCTTHIWSGHGTKAGRASFVLEAVRTCYRRAEGPAGLASSTWSVENKSTRRSALLVSRSENMKAGSVRDKAADPIGGRPARCLSFVRRSHEPHDGMQVATDASPTALMPREPAARSGASTRRHTHAPGAFSSNPFGSRTSPIEDDVFSHAGSSACLASL